MPASTWVGRPPQGYEAAILAALHAGLDPLAEPYTLLANFIVGEREIDLVVIKPNGIFLIEHKWCDSPIEGGINGAWHAILPNGERRQMNGGRENPFQQVIFNNTALSRWLEMEKAHFLNPRRAGGVRFRRSHEDAAPKPMRIHNLIVISPGLHPGCRLELDWRARVIGIPDLLNHLCTQSTPRTDLSAEEGTAIARELWLSPWQPQPETALSVEAPADAATIVRLRLAFPTQPPPSLRQVLGECWAYLRWSISVRRVTARLPAPS